MNPVAGIISPLSNGLLRQAHEAGRLDELVEAGIASYARTAPEATVARVSRDSVVQAHLPSYRSAGELGPDFFPSAAASQVRTAADSLATRTAEGLTAGEHRASVRGFDVLPLPAVVPQSYFHG